MNITPYVLVLFGLGLIFSEFFLPGGIMGVAGALVVIAGVVVFALHATSGIAIVIFALVSFIAVGLLIRFALWRLKKGKGAKGIFLSGDQEGYTASQFSKEYVGKTGEAVSDLKPSGHVLIEGKRVQAVSRAGYLVKGTKIKVVGGDGAHLIVKKDT